MTAIPAVPSEPPLTDEAALSNAELAEIEARAAAATDGPWTAEYSGETGNCVLPPGYESAREYVARTQLYLAVFDAKFIAAARTDVPRLVASLRSAREEITALRGWINDTDAVLEAALGDRWSPDRPPADGVQQLAEERDKARATERQRAIDILTGRGHRFASQGNKVASQALLLAAGAIRGDVVIVDEACSAAWSNLGDGYRHCVLAKGHDGGHSDLDGGWPSAGGQVRVRRNDPRVAQVQHALLKTEGPDGHPHGAIFQEDTRRYSGIRVNCADCIAAAEEANRS